MTGLSNRGVIYGAKAAEARGLIRRVSEPGRGKLIEWEIVVSEDFKSEKDATNAPIEKGATVAPFKRERVQPVHNKGAPSSHMKETNKETLERNMDEIPFSENPAAGLPIGIDGQQRAVDKANGSKALDPVEETAKHLWWLCAGREARMPKGKGLVEYVKAARSLLEKTDAQDWRGVCVSVDGWSENPPGSDRWWREHTKSPNYALDHLTAYYWAGRNGKAPGRKDLEPQSYEPDFMK
jgi:hypothetical protein